MIRRLLLLAALFIAAPAFAQVGSFTNWCQAGGTNSITSGLNSLWPVQASYPSCQITVYNTGTVATATIYSTVTLTPLSNPFCANADGSFTFFAAQSGQYDITMSNSNACNPVTVPPTYAQLPATFMFPDAAVSGTGSGGGGGGGANVFLSNLSTPTAINTNLLCATSGSCNAGSALVPFGSGFFNSLTAGTVTANTSLVATGAINFSAASPIQLPTVSSGVLGGAVLAFSTGYGTLVFANGVLTTSIVPFWNTGSAPVTGNCVTWGGTTGLLASGVPCGGSGTVTGSGTANSLPVWTSPTALGNSLLTQSGTGISLSNGSSLGNLALTAGQEQITLSANDSAHVCPSSPCYSLSAASIYTGAGLATSLYGLTTSAFNNSTGATPGVYGEVISATANAGTVTTLSGATITVVGGNGANTGSVTNQYGVQVVSYDQGNAAAFTITNNKGIDITTGTNGGTGTTGLTNDYGLYIESLGGSGSSNIANHSGLYIADQGAQNYSAQRWFAINVAAQSVGPGFTLNTPVINMGGVYHYSGSGAPTFNCGTGTTPSIYWRTDAASTATQEYGCTSGTSWTANGAGSVTFPNVGAGTNTNSLLMGTGGIFSYTGTGEVNANYLLSSALPALTGAGFLNWNGSGWVLATPPGTGTVTVVSSGSLCSTCIVTGGGTTTLQTPNSSSTMDSSGDMALAGTLGVTGATTLTGGGSIPNSATVTVASGGILTFSGTGEINASYVLGKAMAALPGSTECLTYTGSAFAWASCTSGGSGTVTSFSAGNLSPLFTTSVATATSTPALSFSPSNAAANTLFGNATSGSAAPTFTYTVGTAANDIVQLTSGALLVTTEIPVNSTNGVGNSTSGANFLTSTTNAIGLTITPSNPSTNGEKFEATGTLTAAAGGTGISTSSSTGVAQVLSGTWSISATLANGTLATTQSPGTSNTTVATTAFVFANALANPMTTLGDLTIGGVSGAATRLPGPTGPNGIAQTVCETPSGGAATAEVFCIPGVPLDKQTVGGTNYVLPATDDVHLVVGSYGSTNTPWAGTNMLANNYSWAFLNNSATAVITYTPASGLVYPGGGSTQTIPPLWGGLAYTDNTNSYFLTMPTLAAFPTSCVGSNALQVAAGVFSCASVTVSSSWSALTSPTANLSLALSNGGTPYSSTLTGGDYGASPLAVPSAVFELTDAATTSTDTSYDFSVNVPSTSYHNAAYFGVDGFAQLQVCSIGGASHIGVTVVGSAITCANLSTSPPTKLTVLDATSANNQLALIQTGTSASGTMLRMSNATAAGTGFNFIVACAGGVSSAGLCTGTTQFSVGGAGYLTATGASLANLSVTTSTIANLTDTTSTTIYGGLSASGNVVIGNLLLEGGAQTGAGGSSASGGSLLATGGANAATNTSSLAGTAELTAGQSTGATNTGHQGLHLLGGAYLKGTTVTAWNLQCSQSTAETTQDCAASPLNILGVAEVSAFSLTVFDFGDIPINASAAVTAGHSVCAGTTAGEVTDSGGTAPCTAGVTIGHVIHTGGTYVLPDGTSVTASTTLPIIHWEYAAPNIVSNAGLANSAITIAGTSVSLGGSTSSFPSPGVIGGTTPAAATFTTLTVQNGTSLGGTAYSYGAPSTTGGAAVVIPATTYTVTGSATTANFQGQYTGASTFTDASAGTVTDAFDKLYSGPAAAAGSLTITRAHTLGVVDSTSASSSITGGLVVATTLGTSATSVGIGGGNINAGGTGTFGGLAVTGAATAASLVATGIVDGTAPITITTGTTANLGSTYSSGYTLNQEGTAGTGVTYTLPATAVGKQYCVQNSGTTSVVNTGVLTVYPPASSYVILNGVVNTVGGGGTHGVASGGAAGDGACFVAIDATHWEVFPLKGTWTEN